MIASASQSHQGDVRSTESEEEEPEVAHVLCVLAGHAQCPLPKTSSLMSGDQSAPTHRLVVLRGG